MHKIIDFFRLPTGMWQKFAKMFNHKEENNIIDIEDLLRYHDEDFVHLCYRVLLRRSPDAAGLVHYLDLVRSGVSRTDVIIRLARGNEAKNYGTHIRGLWRTKIYLHFLNVPLFGNIFLFIVILLNVQSISRDLRAFQNYIYRIRKDIR